MILPEITLLELESVDSTNAYAKQHFESFVDGTLVTAEMQTDGRGRLGRNWFSPPGVNIYASLVMKQITNPFYATITGSLATLKLLQEQLPRESFFIKWPNDIYVERKKICGILSECHTSRSGIDGVITGIGININLETEELAGIGQPAASLKSLSGKFFDVRKLTFLLADALAEYYAVYLHSPEKLFAEWKENNFVIGKLVGLVDSNGNRKSVKVLDISETGELITEENGCISRFNCGDVTLMKETFPEGVLPRNGFFSIK